MVKNRRDLLDHGTLKSVYLKMELMNGADFIHADSEAIIFG